MTTFKLELDMEQADNLVVQSLLESREILEEIYDDYANMPHEDKVIYTAIETVLRYYSPNPGVNDVA